MHSTPKLPLTFGPAPLSLQRDERRAGVEKDEKKRLQRQTAAGPEPRPPFVYRYILYTRALRARGKESLVVRVVVIVRFPRVLIGCGNEQRRNRGFPARQAPVTCEWPIVLFLRARQRSNYLDTPHFRFWRTRRVVKSWRCVEHAMARGP